MLQRIRRIEKLILISVFVIYGCAEQVGDTGSDTDTDTTASRVQTTDQAAEIEALRRADQEALRAFKADDAEGFDALYAEDAVLVNPGQEPLEGRAAIDSLHRSEMAIAGEADWEPIRIDVSESGDLGYVYGRWSFTGPAGAGDDHGYYVNVYQKTNGQWKTVVEVNGSSKPFASVTSP
ncbi:MAG: DUF4440 domain-containing protein [Actinobacteria bacterium]|nr:DUF4440 domain-containing protein [Actinomycetota bacterium]